MLESGQVYQSIMNCPYCQALNPDQAKFCMNCGGRLVPSSSTETGKAQPTEFNLDRYLPQELVTKLESARARNSMMGERRVITMLFCDVKGSTAAAEKVDPEIRTYIMNGVFEHMIRPIYKYERLVPRLMGDAILAFFGAPITHEDDPQRAVLAALEIQEGIKSYADEIRLKHGLEFGLRNSSRTARCIVRRFTKYFTKASRNDRIKLWKITRFLSDHRLLPLAGKHDQ